MDSEDRRSKNVVSASRGTFMASSTSRVFFVTALALGLGTGSAATPDFVRITPEALHWVDIPNGHGAQMAILFGNPDKPGLYVIRVRFPPHVMDRPHTHPKDRYVTVLEGIWYAVTGNTFDIARAEYALAAA